MNQSLGLLRTKLFVPKPRTDLVQRPQIIELLSKGLETRLTFISAPNGYGKTTLLSQWIHSTQIPVAWLSLDKTDDQLFRFFLYVVTALQTLEPSIGKELLPLLNLFL